MRIPNLADIPLERFVRSSTIRKFRVKQSEEVAMSRILLFIALGALMTSVIAANPVPRAETQERLPVSVFSSDTAIRSAQISPDGRYLAVVFRHDGEEKLAVLDTKTHKALSSFLVSGRHRSVGDVTWVSDTRLVYGTRESRAWDNTPYDIGELIGVNVDGSRHKFLLGWQSGQLQTGSHLERKKNDYGHYDIIDTLPEDEKHILIAFYPWRLKGNTWRLSESAKPIIYRLNVVSAKKKKLGTLPKPHAKALADSRGQVRFSVAHDGFGSIVHYRQSQDDDWQPFVLNDPSISQIEPISFTSDDRGVFFSAFVDGGTRGLFSLNFDNHSVEKVFHNSVVDPYRYLLDYQQRKVIGAVTEPGFPEYHYIDSQSHKAVLHKALRKLFPDNKVVITSSTKDGGTSVIFVHSDKNPGEFFLYHRGEKRLDFLLRSMDQIDPALMAKRQPVVIEARDGLKLHGYLTLPRIQSKGLPLIVHPHGGPHFVRDHWRFESRVQMLAHYGYAVLQLNFRGSGGFGRSFQEAGQGQWGAAMQDDLTDATRSLIRQGVADPQRICVYGASYGAYAALMAAVREPRLYQCVIGSMGVYDLPMMFREGDIPETSSGLEFLRRTLGTNLKLQQARSPTHNAEKIQASVLLIHGTADQRAPIKQVKAMKTAMDDAGKSYDWLEIKAGGHGFFDESNRELVYRRVLKFLDANIGQPREATPQNSAQ
jgi:dipeptidyl aminopeptidase/acylaminoacyl peptidase